MYQYSALSYFTPIDNNYQRTYFFEILLEGEVLYLRKANKRANLIDNKYMQKAFSRLNVDKSCYDYYMLYDEKVICINNFEEGALPLLTKEYPKKINEFIRKKNIKDFTPHDKLVILHYYNTMQEKTLQLEAAIHHKFESSVVKADLVVREGHFAE